MTKRRLSQILLAITIVFAVAIANAQEVSPTDTPTFTLPPGASLPEELLEQLPTGYDASGEYKLVVEIGVVRFEVDPRGIVCTDESGQYSHGSVNADRATCVCPWNAWLIGCYWIPSASCPEDPE